MTLSESLQELLERATAVEAEQPPAAEVKSDTLTPDAVFDLAQQAAGDSPAVLELREEVEALRDTLLALSSSSDAGLDDDEADDPGMDYVEPDDEPAVVQADGPTADGAVAAGELVDGAAGEFDPTLLPQEKAVGWQPCPDCGSAGADEYADGTARCEDCGTPLSRLDTKAFDFDAADDDEALAAMLAEVPEVKGVQLDEMELLIARRTALGT